MDSSLGTSLLFGISLILSSGFSSAELTCDQSNACYCIEPNGDVINLQPLASANNSPRFEAFSPNFTDPVGVTYNPCKPFNGKGECQDVAACFQDQGEVGETYYTNYGTQDSYKWTLGDGKQLPRISYTNKDKTFIVELQCNKTVNDTLEISSVTNITITTKLTSKCACPGECPMDPTPTPKTKHSLSTGSILLILFFSFVLLYLLGGVIYNKVMHGATGKELLPNVEFWASFPKLCLDGVAFTCNCCGKRRSSPGYDNV